jgi:hypothetical protein
LQEHAGRESQREEEEKIGREKRAAAAGFLSPRPEHRRRRGSPRGIDDGRRATVLLHCAKEDKGDFAKNAPLVFGIFWKF